MVDTDGKIPLQSLLHILNDIPPASKKVTLDLLVSRKQLQQYLAHQLLENAIPTSEPQQSNTSRITVHKAVTNQKTGKF